VTGALLLSVITIEFIAGRLDLRKTVFGRHSHLVGTGR
jgi:hypothetical protein